MTFEEFFIKKKIDLAQLKAAEPELFLEFKSHFALMGEKSFDQVKKFWFNKLRREYHLQEAAKPAKESIVKAKIASQAEPLSSPTIDQKPDDLPASRPVAPNTAEAADQTEAPEKPALKPKFTPRNIPAKPKGTVIGELPLEEVKKEDASKPAASFKPRFNPKNIKPKNGPDTTTTSSEDKKESKEEIVSAVEGEGSETGNQASPAVEEAAAKPSFKPRFNMKNIKPKEGSRETKNQEEAGEPAVENKTEPEEKAAAEAANETKAAYKPRFKMKNVPPKEESGISIPASAPEKNEEVDAASTEREIVKAPEERAELEKAETKPAYKPRFNTKNIQPKEESGISIPASAPEKTEENPTIGSGSEVKDQKPGIAPEEETNFQKEETKPAYKPRFNMKNIKPK